MNIHGFITRLMLSNFFKNIQKNTLLCKMFIKREKYILYRYIVGKTMKKSKVITDTQCRIFYFSGWENGNSEGEKWLRRANRFPGEIGNI